MPRSKPKFEARRCVVCSNMAVRLRRGKWMCGICFQRALKGREPKPRPVRKKWRSKEPSPFALSLRADYALILQRCSERSYGAAELATDILDLSQDATYRRVRFLVKHGRLSYRLVPTLSDTARRYKHRCYSTTDEGLRALKEMGT